MKKSWNLWVKRKQMLSLVILVVTFFSCTKKDFQNPQLELQGGNALLATAPSTAPDSNLIYKEDFEGSNPFGTYVSKQFGTPYAFTVASSPVFEGTKSGRFELRDTDPLTSNGTRTEVRFPALENPNRWYSFSVYFPSAYYQYDSKAEIINQWHQGGGVSPSISLMTRYDKLILETRTVPTEKVRYDLGALKKDKWRTYVLHIIHSHGSDGLIEIWEDGVKIFTKAGANSYDFTTYDKPKWKLGIYKWDWNGDGTTDTKIRVLYFDNIRLGNENACYSNMVSSGTTPTTDPTPTPTPTDTTTSPTSGSGSSAISSFTLINSATEKDVQTITEGSTLSLSQLGVSKLNIRANLSSSVGSVRFELSGPQSYNYVDNANPYALFGDDGKGNYYYGIWNPPATGTYTLKATPYSGTKATGTVGTPVTLHFTITK